MDGWKTRLPFEIHTYMSYIDILYIDVCSLSTYILECPVVKFMEIPQKFEKKRPPGGESKHGRGRLQGISIYIDEIRLTTWDVQNLVNGINYQLVQDFSHQQFDCILVAEICDPP